MPNGLISSLLLLDVNDRFSTFSRLPVSGLSKGITKYWILIFLSCTHSEWPCRILHGWFLDVRRMRRSSFEGQECLFQVALYESTNPVLDHSKLHIKSTFYGHSVVWNSDPMPQYPPAPLIHASNNTTAADGVNRDNPTSIAIILCIAHHDPSVADNFLWFSCRLSPCGFGFRRSHRQPTHVLSMGISHSHWHALRGIKLPPSQLTISYLV